VLSPMWHYMEDTVSRYSYFQPAPKALHTSVFEHKDWDWASVVVLTCENSCHVGDDPWCVAQEEVVAVNFTSISGAALKGANVDGDSVEHDKEVISRGTNDREE
jgi:hypothetical protein